MYLECVRILKPGGWFEFQETRRLINNEEKTLNVMNIKDVKPLPLGSWGGKLGVEFAETFLIALPYFAEYNSKENYYPFEEIIELLIIFHRI
ncbi:hypothetical protein Glove_21g335 [Diversispora epigaea]|uniref:Methyltransferase type 11 domain-containing protein n=1 Tax=Diversispora epigaea TaxID=1348612 RepID=A0A397JPJ9_9GLOM|nr:hypothetical protein Glove_21g335 [Diversispora epigaea]